MAKPKMTLEEACREMRKRGMRMSTKSLADWIAMCECHPFGKVLSVSSTGVRNILILRHDFEAWAETYLGGSDG